MIDKEALKKQQQEKIQYLKHPDPNDKKVKVLRFFIKGLGFLLLCSLILLLFLGYRNHIFDSAQNFNTFIKGLGMWGPVAFICLQALQIVLPVLPAPVCAVAGVLSYGPWIGFLYNYIGTVIGSCLAFLISRRFGATIAKSVTSDETYEKYNNWIEHGEKKFDKLFALAIVLPVAPDDFLCYLAGLTHMSFQKFMLIIVIGKPFTLLSYSFGFKALSIFNIKWLNNWFHAGK